MLTEPKLSFAQLLSLPVGVLCQSAYSAMHRVSPFSDGGGDFLATCTSLHAGDYSLRTDLRDYWGNPQQSLFSVLPLALWAEPVSLGHSGDGGLQAIHVIPLVAPVA